MKNQIKNLIFFKLMKEEDIFGNIKEDPFKK